MTRHEHNAAAGELVGDGNGLLRIARVIADFKLEHFTIDAASGVNVGDGLFGAGLHLFPKGCVLAGHRTSGRNNDFSRG